MSARRDFHHNSTFGLGKRRPLTREGRLGWRAMVTRQLTAGAIDDDVWRISLAMERLLGDDGQLDPTQETIAAASGVPLRTVKRKLPLMRKIGLLDWERRLVREAGQVRQTSNAYVLLTPAEPSGAPSHAAPAKPSAKLARKYSEVFFREANGDHLAAQQQLAIVRQQRQLAILRRVSGRIPYS